MRDEFAYQLESALEQEESERSPDLAWVIARGRRLRFRRLTSATLSVLAVLAIVATMILALPRIGSGRVTTPNPPKKGTLIGGEVVEHMSRQQQAQVFAFRAIAAKGLMDPFGKGSYQYTRGGYTTQTPTGWRIGFAASDCQPLREGRHYRYSCRGLSGGKDPLGNSRPDTFVNVTLKDREWSVVGVDGNMRAAERSRVIGFSLPQRSEPSHWEYPATGYWPGRGLTEVDLSPVWVGPYPSSAPGSICELHALDSEGNRVGEASRWYESPPRRSYEVAGGFRGIDDFEPDQKDQKNIARIVVECRQKAPIAGEGWEVTSTPRLVGIPGEASGVTAHLLWRGNNGLTPGAVCTATLLNGRGKVVWKGSGSVEGRQAGDKTHSYRAVVFVPTGGKLIDAEAVGDFSCKSR